MSSIFYTVGRSRTRQFGNLSARNVASSIYTKRRSLGDWQSSANGGPLILAALAASTLYGYYWTVCFRAAATPLMWNIHFLTPFFSLLVCSVLRPKQQTKNFTANSHLQRSFAKGEDKDRVKLISIEIIGKCFCATNNESLTIHFVCSVGNFHGFFVNWVPNVLSLKIPICNNPK